MNAVILSLGGNLGDRLATLKSAVEKLSVKIGEVRLQSNVYESRAWGYQSAANFYNMVIEIVTNMSAESVLKTCLEIETELGRNRSNKGYADRTCDIDLVFFDEKTEQTELLSLPHPRYHLRKFVLIPLLEIKPEGFDFEKQKSFKTLLDECSDTSTLQKIGRLN